jgi:hypothetical protein
MAFPTPEELQNLVTQFNDVATSYNPSSNLDDLKSRVPIIEKAKEIALKLMAPADMAIRHCLNISNR